MSKIKSAYTEGIVTQIKKKPLLTTILVGGIGYFAYKFINKKVTEVRQEGRIDTADTQGAAVSNVSPFNYTAFDNYWIAGKRYPTGYKILTDASVRGIAKNIYDSMGYITDDEDVVKAQIKRCNSKVKISQLSKMFTQIYKRDLITFLRDGVGVRPNAGLSKEILDEVLKYVNSLPTFTK